MKAKACMTLRSNIYSITCIQSPLKGSDESGLLQQVAFKYRFYYVELGKLAVSEQWSLKAGGLLIQVVSHGVFGSSQNDHINPFPNNKF